jgi:uncharacterized protein HemY
MLGEEEMARTALQKAANAVVDFPDKIEARQRLAVLAMDPRKADSNARTTLENYLREKPNDPAALFRLGQLQERDGVFDQAINSYEKILDLNPLFAPAMRSLAMAYYRHSPDDRKAFDLATKAREAFPDDPEIAEALGILNYRRSSYRQSADLLKQASAKRNDDAEILYYLGQTYRQLEQLDDCKAALDRALNLNLSSKLAEEAKHALADCSDPRRLALLYTQRSPDDPKTFELVVKAHETYRDDMEITKTLGILNYRHRNYPQAEKLLKETAARLTDDSELLYYLGQTYHQLKQWNECKGTLEHALRLNLSRNLVDDAKSALAACSETESGN